MISVMFKNLQQLSELSEWRSLSHLSLNLVNKIDTFDIALIS